MQRSEEQLEGHSVLIPTHSRNWEKLGRLTSFRSQVKDLKSVCLCTLHAPRKSFKNVGENCCRVSRAELNKKG